jgi:hypothetical protein
VWICYSQLGDKEIMGEQEGTTESVQPEGQGAEETSFVGEYLNSVPEDYRPHVEPYLKQIESNVNGKFSEHADYRKQWEPYGELGLTDYEPEDLQGLLQFAELMADEDAFKEWWKAAGQERGLIDELMPEGDDDDDDLLDDENDFESLKSELAQMLDERLNPLYERELTREQEQMITQANESLDEQLAALKAKHGDFNEKAVLKFAYAHADEDAEGAIQKGFEDYQEMIGETEQSVVQRKSNTPGPPERGDGPANTSASPVTSYSEAKELARERLAQAR